ncbi:PTS system IIA component (Glc family) [Mobilisporobacter senegalensis]|uniref:PTS system IIA component (Glc family) n=1 Tax=Mobilisporobacter senegalensis TaxID=1329262 RepID=A0A3N1XJY2_9FIRM|nr:PTS glucose transporter subunit IIA [Mobilisporobacter senegalensis]ROR26388.1 PTS system IIA component (Glc family) [Mobilisporobacter senegalensis]
MFNKLKEAFGLGSKKNVILAPVEGEVCPLSEVSDPTFATGILGKGVAIRPNRGRVVAPANGVVTIMFDTKHAVTITTDTGAEILIHIGLDTVNLKGEHFKSYVKADDRVKAGDLLVEFDIPKIKEAGYEVITPVVICNSDNFPELQTITGKAVKELDEIINI